MSKSFPNPVRLILLPLACALTFVVPAHLKSSTSSSPFLEAQELLRQLYPELKNKRYVMSVELNGAFDMNWTSTPRFSVEVGPSERGHEHYTVDRSGIPHIREEKPVLGALFGFDSEGLLETLHVNSPEIVFGKKNEALRKLVDSHREWNDADVIHALKGSGVRYGPEDRDAFLQIAPFGALEPFIGGAFQIESAEFNFRHQQPSGSLANLYWEVEGASQTPTGKRLHWTIVFEPFGGRLTSIIRNPGAL